MARLHTGWSSREEQKQAASGHRQPTTARGSTATQVRDSDLRAAQRFAQRHRN